MFNKYTNSPMLIDKSSAEGRWNTWGNDIPAHLRGPGNEVQDTLPCEISQELCTPLPTPGLIWSGIQLALVVHAHLIVIPLPVTGQASLKPPCTGQQGPRTAQQAWGASPRAHVINEEMTSFCGALLAPSLPRRLQTEAAGP